MIELINNINNELNKQNLTGSCVLASCLFDQFVPNSKIVAGFLTS